ncbi:BnaC09g13370D [Brassica napus]|uniref:BnaC09g13370D protein n=1 Tax=Brassica napus TaxID=3708 RepID=A0A078H2S0_BRANA|nr:BnaC09g13370D [Brassica napus]
MAFLLFIRVMEGIGESQ